MLNNMDKTIIVGKTGIAPYESDYNEYKLTILNKEHLVKVETRNTYSKGSDSRLVNIIVSNESETIDNECFISIVFDLNSMSNKKLSLDQILMEKVEYVKKLIIVLSFIRNSEYYSHLGYYEFSRVIDFSEQGENVFIVVDKIYNYAQKNIDFTTGELKNADYSLADFQTEILLLLSGYAHFSHLIVDYIDFKEQYGVGNHYYNMLKIIRDKIFNANSHNIYFIKDSFCGFIYLLFESLYVSPVNDMNLNEYTIIHRYSESVEFLKSPDCILEVFYSNLLVFRDTILSNNSYDLYFYNDDIYTYVLKELFKEDVCINDVIKHYLYYTLHYLLGMSHVSYYYPSSANPKDVSLENLLFLFNNFSFQDISHSGFYFTSNSDNNDSPKNIIIDDNYYSCCPIRQKECNNEPFIISFIKKANEYYGLNITSDQCDQISDLFCKKNNDYRLYVLALYHIITIVSDVNKMNRYIVMLPLLIDYFLSNFNYSYSLKDFDNDFSSNIQDFLDVIVIHTQHVKHLSDYLSVLFGFLSAFSELSDTFSCDKELCDNIMGGNIQLVHYLNIVNFYDDLNLEYNDSCSHELSAFPF